MSEQMKPSEIPQFALEAAKQLKLVSIFLQHETSYCVTETDGGPIWKWSCACGAHGEFEDRDDCHIHTRNHWCEVIQPQLARIIADACAEQLRKARDLTYAEGRLHGLTDAMTSPELAIAHADEIAAAEEASREQCAKAIEQLGSMSVRLKDVFINCAAKIRSLQKNALARHDVRLREQWEAEPDIQQFRQWVASQREKEQRCK